MGYMCHHAIIVTSCLDRYLDAAHAKALDLAALSGVEVSPISEPTTNGYRSFMLAPDGSKEGWPESDKGEAVREVFISWLNGQAFDDGSSPVDWALVQFGDDGNDDRLLAAS